jgi:starch synthase
VTKPLRILMLGSEMIPYAKTGGLADVVGALPAALRALGHEVIVVLPRYRGIEPGRYKMKRIGEVQVPLGNRVVGARVDQLPEEGTPYVLFVDHKEYFDRDTLYGTPHGDFPDNGDRFAFFARAALAACALLSWTPDVVHAHDWQTGLAPALLAYNLCHPKRFAKAGRVFTIHNLAYQGNFDPSLLDLTGLPPACFKPEGLEFYGQVSFLKAGLVYSDVITTVSRKYAEEIQTPEFGCGMEGILAHRRSDLVGILNGVDYAEWDPRHDEYLPAHYTPQDLSGKRKCKEALLARLGLPLDLVHKPLVGMIGRLADQKGMDLVAASIDEILGLGVGVVILGSGDARYHRLLTDVAKREAGRAAIVLAFDNALAHQIEAGSDIFLMPSRYEPCGLNQIYSLRYGTIPVVRATGGLDDTIEPYDARTGAGTGFKFHDYSAEAMIGSLSEAVALWKGDRERWEALMREGMRRDFSWTASARRYVEIYRQAIRRRRAGRPDLEGWAA